MSSVSELTDQAHQYAEKYGITGRGTVNNAVDAFRHAYASAVFARDYGAGIAESAGIAWELLGLLHGDTEAASRMDAWNNYVGRTIQNQLGPDATNDQIAAEIKRALDEGRLVTEPAVAPPSDGTDGTRGDGAEGDPHSGMPWPGTTISPTVGTTPDPLVKTIVYVDPLVLDLDGDGLEITPLSQGVLFDANGDTVKTGTAWVGGDDGLLVWDRDGNGTIDTGAELFGDETLLSNGEKAAHGFAALSELDIGGVVDGITVGAGDGVFDAQDAQYSSLRIWRDLNQDGISQANELQTLAQTGVRSINLASRTENTNYGDAILAQSGSFTRADGSTSQAGSFILAQNNFAREFVPIAVRDVTSYFVRRKASARTKCLHARTGIRSQQLFLQKLNLVDRGRQCSNLY